MKKGIIKFLSVFMTVLIMFQGTVVALALSKTKSCYTGSTYTHQTRFDGFDIKNGIDVSEHNGDIDFKKVKADGISFVFVRVGYTGYTKSHHSLNYDKRYKTYLKDAIKAGLSVGVYWYSQALNVKEAQAEAKKVLDVIGSYDITMPVVFDYEFADTPAGRLDSAGLSKSQMTKNSLAFLDRIRSAGYDACLYANESFLKNHLNASQISEEYIVWLANYSKETNYSGDYEFWQYSSKGCVKGVGGYTDVNFWYTGSITDLKKQYYTGKPVEPVPSKVTTEDGIRLKEGTDYVLAYKNNTQVGTALVTAVGIGEYEGFEKKYRFKIVPEQATALTLKSRTTTSLLYEWKSVKGAKNYRVYVKNNTKGSSFYITAKSAKVTVGNLTPANEYTVKVAVGRAGKYGDIVYGPYSKENKKHTLPGQVSNLRAKSIKTSSATLVWDKMSGAQGYLVYRYYPSTGKYKLIKELAGSSKNKLKLTNLKPSSVYCYRVSAYTVDSKKKKTGKKSKLLKFASKPQKSALKSVSNPSNRKIRLKWKSLKCSGYQIQWSTKSNFSSDKKYVFASASKGTSKVIKTAKSNRTYYVHVRAYKMVDGKRFYGSWSSTKKIKVK